MSAWPDVIAGLILVMAAYASTNVDNLLLMTSAASRGDNSAAVIRGFLLSSATVLGLSVAFVGISMYFSPRALGLLGLIPIFVGLQILLNLRNGQGEATLGKVRALSVGLTLLANSTDTVAVLGPLFAESEPAALFSMLVGYVLMAGLWIVLVLRLAERIGRMHRVKMVAQWATPVMMIVIGIYILLDTTTDTLVAAA